ncbi:TPA: ead/Ea22-like family protein [Escherichia coli]|uniref:ead/Ea22-like family protein n=1 Tax=Escherichia coli TaxID=562 RepID=UPI001FF434F8|nr:ead/Ea22-like family protein [Escherichia coli]EGI6799932.1 ead/Ea22-like family protein [Escherichia coli]
MSTTTELELAQRMKAAALKATQGEWCAFSDHASGTYAVHTLEDKRCGDVIKWPGFDGQKNAERNAEFIALANPANVLELVEALEAAEKRNAELEEKQRLIDLCHGQGLEHRLAAEKRAEAAEKRMAELETYSKTTLEFREAALNENRNLRLELEIAEKRIAELEARTVKLPDYSETYTTGFASEIEHQVRKVLEMAGVAVEGE